MLVTDIERSNGKIIIEGLQNVQIGIEKENTLMAAIHYVIEALGEDYSYAYLMGMSGTAFRFQFAQPLWCPSSPHADMGFRTTLHALDAVPYKIDIEKDIDKDNPTQFEKIWKRVHKAIDNGEPVIFQLEESGIIVGVNENTKSFIVRPPYITESGYVLLDETHKWLRWPWSFDFFVEKDEVPVWDELIRDAFERIVMLAESEQFDGFGEGSIHYLAGFHGLEKWIELLKSPDHFLKDEKQSIDEKQHANGHIYYSLADAREAARDFFEEIIDDFDGEVRQHIADAQLQYSEIAAIMTADCPTKIAPMPYMLAEGEEWTQTMRIRQAEILEKVLDFERVAVSEIKQALEKM